MHDWLEVRAQSDPSGLCLVDDRQTLSFAELNDQVAGAAGTLGRAGVVPGDRVAVWGGNDLATVRALWAVPRAGAVLVPLNTRLTESEAAWQARDAAVSLLIGPEERPDLDVPSLGLDDLGEGRPAAPHTVLADAPHSIVYTSGSSGRPKGAILTWGNHEASAAAAAVVLEHDVRDRWLTVLPLYHVGGLAILIRSARAGGSVALERFFEPARVAALLGGGSITLLSLVPTMLGRLLDLGPGPYPNLRTILLGGGPTPEALLSRASAAGVPVINTYGLTEAASQVATAPLVEARAPRKRARPIPGVEIRIVAEDGSEVEHGHIGTIAIRGPMVSPGYVHGALRQPGSWLPTGDLGRLDADGCLEVLGRSDDTIVSGGENVYPSEVEAALLAHPQVTEAAVFGTPHPEWGWAVTAAVVSSGADAGSLDAFLRSRLAGYKIPRRWRFVDELPRTALGKVERSRLAEQNPGGS